MTKINNSKKMLMIIVFIAIALSAFLISRVFISTQAQAATEVNTTQIEDILSFSLFNNSTEYRVKARNKDIEVADIPDYYKGIPVTEIPSYAFLNCKNLKRVSLPKTLIKIGSNAFGNCVLLEELNGLVGIKDIGNSAFANCSMLNNIILPQKIEKLGTSIFRDNGNTIYCRMTEEEMTALNKNWDTSRAETGKTVYINNELQYDEVHDENGNKIGYSVIAGQNLDHSGDDVILWATTEDTKNSESLQSENSSLLPILEIQSSAFSRSKFKSLTIKYREDDNEQHDMLIRSEAFSATETYEINIEVNAIFDDDGGDVNTFGGCTDLTSITLPDTLTELPNGFFAECNKLSAIHNVNEQIKVNHLSSKIKSIGSMAFLDCYALRELYLPESISYIADSAFFGFGDGEVEQTIYIDCYAPNALWSSNWKDGLGDNVNFHFKEASVTLDKKGGDPEQGTNNITVSYGEEMPQATAPNRKGYTFKGYYDSFENRDNQYYNWDMSSDKKWDKGGPCALYAHWEANNYTVTFDKQSGSGGADSVVATYDSDMPTAVAPQRKGYDFLGYFEKPNGEGVQYYGKNMKSVHTWDVDNDITIYAHWEIATYTITYILIENNNSVFVNHDNPTSYTIYDEVIISDTEYEQYTIAWLTHSIAKGNYGDKTIYGIVWVNVEPLHIPHNLKLTTYKTIHINLPDYQYGEKAPLYISCDANVCELEIIGAQTEAYYMCIDSKANDFYLKLTDVNINAPVDHHGIKMNDNTKLTISATTDIKIRGGNNGCSGIYCGELFIITCKNVEIIGGTGKKGAYQGGSAVYVSNNSISASFCGIFKLVGGTGGQGRDVKPGESKELGGKGGFPCSGTADEISIYRGFQVEDIILEEGASGNPSMTVTPPWEPIYPGM